MGSLSASIDGGACSRFRLNQPIPGTRAQLPLLLHPVLNRTVALAATIVTKLRREIHACMATVVLLDVGGSKIGLRCSIRPCLGASVPGVVECFANRVVFLGKEMH